MTTLDDVERTLDADVCVIDDAEGPTSIAGVMGGARSEVARDHDARADGGGDLERARTSSGPPRASACARRRPGASRSSSQPEQALDGQAVASALMVELCGARPVGGTIDVGGAGPEPAVRPPCARRGSAAARRAGAAAEDARRS